MERLDDTPVIPANRFPCAISAIEVVVAIQILTP
jgi:hypothetical protein